MSSMRTDVVTTSDELDQLTDQWWDLVRRDPHSTFYSSPDFVRPWWNSFRDDAGTDLCCIAVHDSGRLVGLAPLAVHTEQRGDRPVRVIRYCGRADYLTILIDPGAGGDTVLKRIFRALEHDLAWDIVWLSNIPSQSPVAGYLMRSSLNSSFRFWIENPYIDLRHYDSFEEYRARRMPTKAPKYRNKFLREVPAEFRVLHGDAEGIFEQIADLHQQEKHYLVDAKGRGERHSLYEDSHRRRHIEEIFRTTDRAVTFAYVSEHGELLAYRTCFRDGRRLLSWNSAYHPRIADYRPGKVLQFDILQYLFGSGCTDIFDFGAGRYPWKFEWTDDFSVTYRLHLKAHESVPSAEGAATVARPDSPTVSADQTPPQNSRAASPPRVPATPVRTPESAAAQADSWRSRVPEPIKKELRRVRGRYLEARRRRELTRPRPTIWYVPHPDDESIFMAGSIHANRSQPNVIVLLSRGGASAARDKLNERLPSPLDVESFMDAREREFREAVTRLQVRRLETVVLNLPDGAFNDESVRAVVQRMEAQHPGWTHRTMSFLDPHPDHRAAGRAVRAARRAGQISDCVFHVPYPLVDDGPGIPVRLSRSDRLAKRAALEQYTTWDPERGRFAIGDVSVGPLIEEQSADPHEVVHGWRERQR